MAVEAIFQHPYNPWPLAALEQIRAFGKQNNVNFSLFHHVAVGEVGQAEFASRGLKGMLGGLITGGNELWKGTVAGIQEAMGKTPSYRPPIVSWPKEMVDPFAGRLYFNTMEHEHAITESLRQAPPRDAPLYARLLSPPLRAIGNVSYVFNRGLFDFYQQGLMLKAANKIYADWLDKNPGATPKQINDFLDVNADHVNRAFGAQNLEELMLSPNTRRFLSLLLFAPVWTLSNVRVVTAGYDTITGKRLTNRYLASAAASWFLTTQLANYALTGALGMKDKYGVQRAHWTWDNAGAPLKVGDNYVPGLTENFFNIGFGRNANGTERYFRFGKPYREFPNWATDPAGTFQAKMSRLVGLIAVPITGAEPGGYRVWDQQSSPEQKRWRTIAETLDFATPFSAQFVTQKVERAIKPTLFPEPSVTSQFAGVPTRQGLSFNQAVDRYREAKDAGREDIAQQVLQAAQWNNLSPIQIVQRYRRPIRTGIRAMMGPRVTYDVYGNVQTTPPPEPPEQ
jgi:hypothetical protein